MPGSITNPRAGTGGGTGGGLPGDFTDWLLPDALFGPPAQAVAHGATQLRTVRAVAPKDGTLGGLWAANTGLGTGSSVCGVIYGVDKTTLLRTRLWQGAWFAAAVANNWFTLGNPGIAVAKADALELGLAVAAAGGPTFLRVASWAIGPRLPNNGDFMGFLLNGISTAANGLPTSIALATLTTGTPAPYLVGSYA